MPEIEKLRGLKGPDKLEALRELDIEGCKSIERLPDLSSLKSLMSLHTRDCEKLQGLEGLHKLHELEILNISRCKSTEKLPGLGRM